MSNARIIHKIHFKALLAFLLAILFAGLWIIGARAEEIDDLTADELGDGVGAGSVVSEDYYFVCSDHVKTYYKGGSETVTHDDNTVQYRVFQNKEANIDNYVKYPNVVKHSTNEEERYDLIILPYTLKDFDYTAAACQINVLQGENAGTARPGVSANSKDEGNGYRMAGYYLYVCPHTSGSGIDLSKAINCKLKLCLSDLDGLYRFKSTNDLSFDNRKYEMREMFCFELGGPPLSMTKGKSKIEIKTNDRIKDGSENPRTPKGVVLVEENGTLIKGGGTSADSGASWTINGKTYHNFVWSAESNNRFEGLSDNENKNLNNAKKVTVTLNLNKKNLKGYSYNLLNGLWTNIESKAWQSSLWTSESNLFDVRCEDHVKNKNGTKLGTPNPAVKTDIKPYKNIGGFDFGKDKVNQISTEYPGYTLVGETRISAVLEDSVVYRFYMKNCTNILRYDLNGGTGSFPDDSKTGIYSSYQTKHIVSSGIPTRSGYTFGGWTVNSTDPAGRTVSPGIGSTVKGGDPVNITGGENGSGTVVILKAKWNPITYKNTLNYNTNGGSAISPNPDTANVIYPYTEAPHNTKSTTRDGYDFIEWEVTDSPSGVPAKGTKYSPNTNIKVGKNNVAGDQTATITAKWEEWGYNKLHYDLNGGNANGITDPPQQIGKSTNKYISTFTVTTIKPTKPDKDFGDGTVESYDFDGWKVLKLENGVSVEPNINADISGGSSITVKGGSKLTTIVTLQAQWKAHYDIRYEGNGATSGTTKHETKYEKVDYRVKNNNWAGFEKTYWDFTGWKGTMTKTDNPTGYKKEDEPTWPLYTKDHAYVLQAQWTKHPYKLTIILDEGVVKATTPADTDDENHKDIVRPEYKGTIKDTFNVPWDDKVDLEAFTRIGYKFKAWIDESEIPLENLTVENAPTSFIMPKHDVVLRATAYCINPQQDIAKNVYSTVPRAEGVVQKVTFHASGAPGSANEPYAQDGIKDNDKLIANKFSYTVEDQQQDGDVISTTATFVGWKLKPEVEYQNKTDENGNVVLDDEGKPKKVVMVDFYDEDIYKMSEETVDKENVDLYAVWEVVTTTTHANGEPASVSWTHVCNNN